MAKKVSLKKVLTKLMRLPGAMKSLSKEDKALIEEIKKRKEVIVFPTDAKKELGIIRSLKKGVKKIIKK